MELIYSFYMLNRKEKATYLPRTAWLFEDLCQFRQFPSDKGCFSYLLLFSSLSYLYTLSTKSFPTTALAQSRITARTFSKLWVSWAMPHDVNVLKISSTLGIFKSSITLYQSVSPFSSLWTVRTKLFSWPFACLIGNNLANIFKPRATLSKTKTTSFLWRHPCVVRPIIARVIFTTLYDGEEKGDVTKIQMCEIRGLVAVFRENKMKNDHLTNLVGRYKYWFAPLTPYKSF